MLLLLWARRKNQGPIYWLLILVPMALPLFFIIEYSAWLWWYGHSLNRDGCLYRETFYANRVRPGQGSAIYHPFLSQYRLWLDVSKQRIVGAGILNSPQAGQG